jgi:hypothetical protein
LELGRPGDPAAAAEADAAQEAERADTAADAAGAEADEAVRMTLLAKQWVRGRPGIAAPEPSLVSEAAAGAADGTDREASRGERECGGGSDAAGGADDDELLSESDFGADGAPGMPVPPELQLQRSQTMSQMQGVSFALAGGSVMSQMKPLPGGTPSTARWA